MLQIQKLANFIMEEVEGYPNASEGAGDCAIRIIKDQKAHIEELRAGVVRRKKER